MGPAIGRAGFIGVGCRGIGADVTITAIGFTDITSAATRLVAHIVHNFVNAAHRVIGVQILIPVLCGDSSVTRPAGRG